MIKLWRGRSQPSERYSFRIDLDSSMPGEKFTATFDVLWDCLPGLRLHPDPKAVIRDYLRTSAESISSEISISRSEAAADRINAVLGTLHEFHESGFRMLQADARISVDPNQLSYADDRERSQNRARQRQQELANEILHVEAFRSQLLADPGMALAYWFMKHPDKVGDDTYSKIENLAGQVASYSPNNIWVQLARIIQDFVSELTQDERRQSLHFLTASLKVWFLRYGMPEYINRLPQDLDGDAPSTVV
ncbi:MAG TPA: hypothetical protein VIZ18_03085 [Ktedonobacteraceae bacterium]